MIPADLQQNLFYTIYFTLAHNFLAIFYAFIILFFSLYLIYKPSRWALFIFYGFILLLFAFQYDKHIVDPLYNQTVSSVITVTPHLKAERVIYLLLIRLLPLLLPFMGLALIITGIILKMYPKELKNMLLTAKRKLKLKKIDTGR